MEKRIDLHIHTNLSDGILSPKEVIDIAYKNGVGIISITDHDTIDAYNQEMYDFAKEKHIEVITGVEISAKFNNNSVHILGYNFDINNQELKNKLELLKNARHDYLYNVVSKLQQLGYKVDFDRLKNIEVVTKAHVALDIIDNKENYEILLKNFKHIPNKGEFIENVMNEGCAAYVKKESITPEDAAQLIKSAGGKVILAHPVAYNYEDNLTDEDILNLVVTMQADGIEGNYIYIDCNNNKINEIVKWNKFAKDNNLLVTTGSDFHNKDGIHPEIGLINEEILLDNKISDDIICTLLRRN